MVNVVYILRVGFLCRRETRETRLSTRDDVVPCVCSWATLSSTTWGITGYDGVMEIVVRIYPLYFMNADVTRGGKHLSFARAAMLGGLGSQYLRRGSSRRATCAYVAISTDDRYLRWLSLLPRKRWNHSGLAPARRILRRQGRFEMVVGEWAGIKIAGSRGI